jgi:hypothetical protein
MKKTICIAIFKMMLFVFCYAQNNAKIKFVTPVNQEVSFLVTPLSSNAADRFSHFMLEEDANTNILAFLVDRPLLKLRASPKKHMLLSAQLSFTDLLENKINNLNAGLLNKYDDHITELFRDAPSLFTLKCSIGL